MRAVVLVLLAGCGRLGFTESHDVPDASPVDADVCAPASTADWALWPMPNTRDPGLPHQPSYAPTATTVTDNVTGLVWQREVPEALLSAGEAATYCDQLVLDGHCDWRLPHRIELISIVAYVAAGPAADPTAFPATQAERFWTATTDSSAAANRWYVDFADGLAETTDAGELHRVRCVRGGGSAPTTRYEVSPASVRDTQTGLTWQRAVDAGAFTFADAITYCAGLNLDGQGWRMPSVGELQTLVDSRFNGPAVDPVAFPSAPIDLFWTGSLRANATTDGWTVNFARGVGFRDTSVGLRARCVR